MNKIVGIVVTYNRKELLDKCLTAILDQEEKLDKILLIDNCSTDGTDEMIRNKYINEENFIYLKLEKNLGGAGGFYEGIKYAQQNLEFDYLWILDDDTIADKKTIVNFKLDLDFLLSKNEKLSYLSSSVFGVDDEPMNVPEVSTHKDLNGYGDWYRFLDNNLIRIDSATFVSILISKEAIQKVGLPYKEFFIWGDDTEYTKRLSQYFGAGYLSGNSKVIHERYDARPIDILTENNKNRIPMYYYYFRNRIFIAKKYNSTLYACAKTIFYSSKSFKVLFSDSNYKMKKVHYIIKGSVSGLFFKPKNRE